MCVTFPETGMTGRVWKEWYLGLINGCSRGLDREPSDQYQVVVLERWEIIVLVFAGLILCVQSETSLRDCSLFRAI